MLDGFAKPKRKRLASPIEKDKWYIGIPSFKGHRGKLTGKIRWDYFTYLPLSLKEPIQGRILGDWSDVIEFDTYHEAKEYIEYLNSDVAMFTLWLNGKRGTNLAMYFKVVPYRADMADLTDSEKTAISKVMEGFGNKWFIEKSLREKGKVNMSHINCKIELTYEDSVGDEKTF